MMMAIMMMLMAVLFVVMIIAGELKQSEALLIWAVIFLVQFRNFSSQIRDKNIENKIDTVIKALEEKSPSENIEK